MSSASTSPATGFISGAPVKYSRVMLKISGEALMGDQGFGLNPPTVARIAAEVKAVQELGVETAYNLDGGGSSTMVFNGTVINQPTSGKRISERKVSDIVYIG